MKRNSKNKTNKGFTLVELIVVLVILAILAAILVPALLGYIDSARSKQYLINAKNCLNATQAEFSAAYAQRKEDVPQGTAVISGAQYVSTSGNFDQDIVNTDFAKRILKVADMEGNKAPYCFMVAVGSNAPLLSGKTYTVTEHDKYTVYYAFYQEGEKTAPWYYYNGNWTQRNPRAYGDKTNSTDTKTQIFDGDNIVQSGSLKDKRLQYYVISNRTQYKDSIKSSGFWDWLKKMR